MGGALHSRPKRIIGERLAQAASAIVYGDKTAAWTGPVLDSCEINGGAVTLHFDQAKLLDDAVLVLGPLTSTIGLSSSAYSPAMLELMQQLVGQTPMEVQLNGDLADPTKGVWLPAILSQKCSPWAIG